MYANGVRQVTHKNIHKGSKLEVVLFTVEVADYHCRFVCIVCVAWYRHFWDFYDVSWKNSSVITISGHLPAILDIRQKITSNRK